MSIVTFWSNNEKTIGQTVAASVAATIMAMEHNYKILLISADINNNSIEACFGAQQSNKKILKNIISAPQMNLETGMSGLMKIAKSNRVTPELIKDYTKIIYKNRLEVLYSSSNSDLSVNEQMECYKTIILNASKYYDYVFVDLRKGIKYQFLEEILNVSDVIVLNTEQGINTLMNFFKMKEMQKYIKEYKIIWNICRYDSKSKYNKKNLNRTFWKRQPIYSISYNTLLFEAVTDGTLPELLLRLRTVKSDDESMEILKEGKELVKGILIRKQELQMRMK